MQISRKLKPLLPYPSRFIKPRLGSEHPGARLAEKGVRIWVRETDKNTGSFYKIKAAPLS